MLAITPERYQRHENLQFDDCHNAYFKPYAPVHLDLLSNLHKKSDFEGSAQPSQEENVEASE